MTFGEEGKSQARVHDLAEVEKILDVFQKHGHKEVDTVSLRNPTMGISADGSLNRPEYTVLVLQKSISARSTGRRGVSSWVSSHCLKVRSTLLT